MQNMAEAFKKANLFSIHSNDKNNDVSNNISLVSIQLTSNELENGLTLSIINNLVISNHAKKRGKERFNIINEIELDKTIRQNLKIAKYIGLVPASDGNESYLYVHNGMGIHISTELDNVNTLVKYGENYLKDVLNNYNEIKNAFMNIQAKQLQKLIKSRRTLKKKVINDKLDYNVEIAELDRKIHKTKSEKAKSKYIERKVFLINDLENQEKYLDDLEKKVRYISGSLAFLNK